MRRKMENKNSGGLAVGEAGLRTSRDSRSLCGSTGLDYLRGSVSTLRRLHLNASRRARVSPSPPRACVDRTPPYLRGLRVSPRLLFRVRVFRTYRRRIAASVSTFSRLCLHVSPSVSPRIRLPVSPNMRLSPSVARVVFVSSRVPVSVSPPPVPLSSTRLSLHASPLVSTSQSPATHQCIHVSSPPGCHTRLSASACQVSPRVCPSPRVSLVSDTATATTEPAVNPAASLQHSPPRSQSRSLLPPPPSSSFTARADAHITFCRRRHRACSPPSFAGETRIVNVHFFRSVPPRVMEDRGLGLKPTTFPAALGRDGGPRCRPTFRGRPLLPVPLDSRRRPRAGLWAPAKPTAGPETVTRTKMTK